MEKGKHGAEEKEFGKLSYSGQAKSINAQILSLERAFKSHIKKGNEENRKLIEINEMKVKYISQLERLIKNLS